MVEVDSALARRLLEEQHPDLAALPLRRAGWGWDNRVFRLGDDLVVRLPYRAEAAVLVRNEQRWLPALAPRLPLAVPVPVRVGRPGQGYPWAWSVCPWFAGDIAVRQPPSDPIDAAEHLGEFVRALHIPAPRDAPVNRYRGTPLREREHYLHEHLANTGSEVDSSAVTALWNQLVATPAWTGPRVWLHGDLHPCNIVVTDGRLSAVIDFGDVTAGDPATDLSVGWMLFGPEARETFRAAAGDVDDATWARARGWALALSIAYVAGASVNPTVGAVGRRTLAAALAG